MNMYESKTVCDHLLTISPKKSPTPESKQVRDAIIDVHPRHKSHGLRAGSFRFGEKKTRVVSEGAIYLP